MLRQFSLYPSIFVITMRSPVHNANKSCLLNDSDSKKHHLPAPLIQRWVGGLTTAVAVVLGCGFNSLATPPQTPSSASTILAAIDLPDSTQIPAEPILISLEIFRTLIFGDVGTDVEDLQIRLADLGYYTSSIDGEFGALTEDAVIRFQSDYGLQADGVVGSETLAALERGSVNSSTSATRYNSSGSQLNYDPLPSLSETSYGVLRRGDSGAAVTQLQRRLNQLDFYDGPVGGTFGERTEDGVRRFQRSQNLNDDGVVGPATSDALRNPRSLSPVSRRDDAPRASPSSLFQSSTATFGTSTLPDGRYSVTDLQQRLQRQGFYLGPIDGILGPQTQEAVVDAQTSYGLTQRDVLNSGF